MHCNGRWSIAAVAALVILGRSAPAWAPPRIVAQPAPGKIELDGKLDDPGWQAAAGFDRFVFLGTDTPDSRRARGLLTYDEQNLYIAVECGEDNPRAKFTPPGEGDVFPAGPHIEVWIEIPRPPRNMARNGLQFCANALGARYDCWLAEGTSPQLFDGAWRSAGRRLDGGWTVEMAIPFADLGLDGPLPGGRPLRMDIGRAEPLVSWAGSWGGLPELSGLGLVFFGSNDSDAAPPMPPDPNPQPEILFVNPAGSDDNPGGKEKPFQTIQRAVDAAGPGDTVEVAPGLYRERVMIQRGGAQDKPLVIAGQPGAVIHGGDTARGWEAVGRGVYKKTGLAYIPYCMTWDDRSVLYIRKQTKKNTDGYAVYFEGNPAPELWDGIEVIFSSEGDTAWVRSRSGGNPDDHDVTLAPIGTDAGGGTVNLVGVSNVTLRGFTIKGGDSGVYLKDAGDNLIEKNHIQHGKNSLYLHYRCHRNEIRDNYLTMRAFCDMNRIRNSRQAMLNVVNVIKGYGRADHHGILMFCTGHGNTFHHNCIYSHWDGVKANVNMPRSGDPAERARQVERISQLYGRDFDCHHNVIRDCWDYGIEPCGGEVNARYHHNLLYNNYGSRIKSIGTGPVYFYNNFYATPYRGLADEQYTPIGRDPQELKKALEDNLAKCSFYISNQNEARLYVYHNTFAGMIGIGLGRPPERYSGNWWFVNNICSGPTPLSVWRERGRAYHLHHNYFSAAQIAYGLTENHTGNILADKLLWPAGLPGLFVDFRIGSDWPVRGKGIDLSREWEREGVKHPALPGMAPGYFQGSAPDLGALQFGEEMPDVGPRW